MHLTEYFPQLKNLLFIDIETISGAKEFGELSDRMKSNWQRKAKYATNEGLSLEDSYQQRAAIYAEFGKVIVIAVGFFALEEDNGTSTLAFRVKSLASHDETQLLHDFKSLITEKFNQKQLRLVAHNGFEFDIPYLCRRMTICGISLPWALNLAGRKPWENPHIDTMELWKFGDRKHYTPLDLLAAIFDIPSPKDDIDGSQVGTVYYGEENGLERIAAYCQNDVIATAQVYLKLQCLPLVDQERIYKLGSSTSDESLK